jgi:cystathionine beta-synthase
MTSAVHTLPAHAPLSALKPIFDRNEVAVVMDGEEFVGLITRVDLINHLRLSA